MRSWQPEPDEPVLLAWFAPLLALARRAREDEVHWPIHIDEFHLLGRFERRPRPDIWMYAHVENGGVLLCDDTGTPYRYLESPTGRSRGQFRETEVRRALRWARLNEVVDPVWYHRPSARPEPVAEVVHEAPETLRRRAHLRLVVDNRSA